MSFGDGSDGDVVVSVNTTLTRDMNYNNLTVNAGVVLNPDGYVIYANDILLVNGTISRNGNNGSGVTAGAALSTNIIGGSGVGGAGGPLGNDGENGEDVEGIADSTGGDGGTSHGPYPAFRWDGGIGGVTSPHYAVTYDDIDDIITNAAARLGGPGGGGGGAYQGSSYNRAGGGGGSGAGVIYISARYITVGITGLISLKGGDGGTSGWCGGGGGGGGCLVIEYETLVNDGIFNVSGGLGGSFADNGTSGTVYLFEYVAPIPSTEGIPDALTLGRFGKKRRHRVEV